MQMNQVILERRRALGLTQEQVADALGVTTPAVNKWEKGSTCPDISLLAPLARLLGVDLNELLCFHESLTDQEVHRFTKEVMQAVDREGLEAGFALAREKLRVYPNSDFLAYSLAAILQGMLSLSADGEARDIYEQQIARWYAQAAASDDSRIRDRASLMLADRSIRLKDWDAAQCAIDALPERPPIDRRVLQARLLSAQENPDEAARLLEEVVLAAGQELFPALLSLVDAEIAAGDLATAEALAKTAEAVARSLDQWEYTEHAAPLQVAVAQGDVRKAVRYLRLYLEAIDRPWKPFESPLYHRISNESNIGVLNERVISAMLKDLATNPAYDFLREDAEFQELIAQYQSRAEQA